MNSVLKRRLLNLPGWHTKRKIIVIESDDWGSIRMPSKETLNLLVKRKIRVDKLSYNKYDSLASETDLTKLFETLDSVHDKNGNPAKLTANTIVANPDFEKIEKANYMEYFYEPFTETLMKYPNHSKSFQLWKDGISSNLFRPQFHGREHLNVSRWLDALQRDSSNVRLAFNLRMFDLSESLTVTEDSFMEALNFRNNKELEFQKKAIIEGANLFKEIFNYSSESFIAPCYTWNSSLNSTLKASGINCLQGIWYQYEPSKRSQKKAKKIFHYTGQKNKEGQLFLNRNASFEPSQNPSFDYINDCLARINSNFKSNKPTIIGAHRLNFIGFIDPQNRDRNLKTLTTLLKEIVKKWPEVEFMSTDELYNYIIKE